MMYLGSNPIGINNTYYDSTKMVGEFSKYQRISAVPESKINLTFMHNLGVVPKLISITSAQERDSEAGEMIQYVIANQNVGGAKTTYGACVGYLVDIGSLVASNGHISLTDDTVLIRRNSTTRNFNPEVTYTIDLYA